MKIVENYFENLSAAQKISLDPARQSDKKYGNKANNINNEKKDQKVNPDDQGTTASPYFPHVTSKIEQDSIHISDLIRRLNLIKQNEGQIFSPTSLLIAFKETIEMELSINTQQKIEGLIVHDKSTAESDRYLFNFNLNGAEFTIIDKWTQQATRIWGDGEIDLPEMVDPNHGKSIKLGGTDSSVTFMLMDGSRVTINAKNNTIIESVDIFNGNDRIQGTGKGSPDWQGDHSLFDTKIRQDGFSTGLIFLRGEEVFAGGDGSDWYSASGVLVWGKTSISTASANTPNNRGEFTINRWVEETIAEHRVEKSV